MKLDEMISALKAIKEHVGGDVEVPIVTTRGENDYTIVDYPIVGDFEDQDGNKFKCALLGSMGGEEFSAVGTPHYSWNPQKNQILFAETASNMENRSSTLHIKMEGAYWEDAAVNGVEEPEENPTMPGFCKDDNSVCWEIDVDTGKILNWKPGNAAKVWYKVVDEFSYDYDGFHYGPDYVPEFMSIDDKGFGDYVYVTVDGTGYIKNWNKKCFLRKHNEYKNADNK